MDYISGIEIEFSIRILIALVLGMVIGIERVRAHKIAGPRTYALVSMGAALFIVTGELVYETVNQTVDSLRIAAQIVVGIGFLGGGMIMFKNGEKTGLTTAAGLWVAAAIGVACGFGFYTLAIVATLATLLTFTILWEVENKFIAPHDDTK